MKGDNVLGKYGGEQLEATLVFLGRSVGRKKGQKSLRSWGSDVQIMGQHRPQIARRQPLLILPYFPTICNR